MSGNIVVVGHGQYVVNRAFSVFVPACWKWSGERGAFVSTAKGHKSPAGFLLFDDYTKKSQSLFKAKNGTALRRFLFVKMKQ